MGKPHSGLLNAHFTWLGDYDECRAVQSAVRLPGETSSPYTGRYCKAAFGNYQQQVSRIRNSLKFSPFMEKIIFCKRRQLPPFTIS